MKAIACAVLLVSLPVCAEDDAGVADYDAVRARLDANREQLASEWKAAKSKDARAKVLSKARERLHRAISLELIPAWFGTKWAFYGTTEKPGEGTIACGYFVTTVLSHAGLHVERARLAQQASEQIVKTLAPEKEIRRYRRGDVSAVVQDTLERGDGLYVVGLDYHVGLLDVRGGEVKLCHSAVLAPGSVICEPALTAEGMSSAYHVVGKLLTDDVVSAWLAERKIVTVVAN